MDADRDTDIELSITHWGTTGPLLQDAISTIQSLRERVKELEGALEELIDEGQHYSFENFGRWQSLNGTEQMDVARKALNGDR